MWDIPEEGEVIKERRRRETVIAWIVITSLVLAMLLRALLSFAMFGERPRTWQYRSKPYVPAEAYSSTRPPSRRTVDVPKQVQLPPPAQKQSPSSSRRSP